MNDGVPEGWITRRLGEFCSQKILRAQNKNLRPFSISKILGIVPQEEKFKKRVASADISNYKIIEPKDFAYDPMLLWDGSINRNNRIETGAVSPAYVVFQISSTIIDSDYFLHFLKSPLTINFYKNISKGTNKRRQKAEFSDFSSGTFNFPPPPEQKKIASILTSVDEAIENTQKQIDKLKDLKKATMNELLTKGTGHTEFKDSKLGRIPEGWEVTCFGEQLALLTDYTANGSFGALKENVSSYNEPNYACLVRTTDLEKRRFQPERFTDKKGFEFLSKSTLFEGDIVFANVGSAGKAYRIPSYLLPMTLAPNMYLLRFNSESLDADFVFQVLIWEHTINNLKKRLGTTTLSAINKSAFRALTLPRPPLPEQKKIASILSSIDKNIEKKQHKLDKRQSLKKSLMQDLLTGKVRVQVN